MVATAARRMSSETMMTAAVCLRIFRIGTCILFIVGLRSGEWDPPRQELSRGRPNRSPMLELGAQAPDFGDLQGADGARYSLRSFDDKPVLVVVFTCNHCPYAVAYEDRVVAIQRDYSGKGVQLVAINSNDDKSYPEDGY